MSDADLSREQVLMIQANMIKHTAEFNQKVADLGYDEAVKQLRFDLGNIYHLALNYQFAIKYEKARKKILEDALQAQFVEETKLNNTLKQIKDKQDLQAAKLRKLNQDVEIYEAQKAEEEALILKHEEEVKAKQEAERIAAEKAAKKKKMVIGGTAAAAAAAFFLLKE